MPTPVQTRRRAAAASARRAEANRLAAARAAAETAALDVQVPDNHTEEGHEVQVATPPSGSRERAPSRSAPPNRRTSPPPSIAVAKEDWEQRLADLKDLERLQAEVDARCRRLGLVRVTGPEAEPEPGALESKAAEHLNAKPAGGGLHTDKVSLMDGLQAEPDPLSKCISPHHLATITHEFDFDGVAVAGFLTREMMVGLLGEVLDQSSWQRSVGKTKDTRHQESRMMELFCKKTSRYLADGSEDQPDRVEVAWEDIAALVFGLGQAGDSASGLIAKLGSSGKCDVEALMAAAYVAEQCGATALELLLNRTVKELNGCLRMVVEHEDIVLKQLDRKGRERELGLHGMVPREPLPANPFTDAAYLAERRVMRCTERLGRGRRDRSKDDEDGRPHDRRGAATTRGSRYEDVTLRGMTVQCVKASGLPKPTGVYVSVGGERKLVAWQLLYGESVATKARGLRSLPRELTRAEFEKAIDESLPGIRSARDELVRKASEHPSFKAWMVSRFGELQPSDA